MKKRVLTILLSGLICLSLAAPARASVVLPDIASDWLNNASRSANSVSLDQPYQAAYVWTHDYKGDGGYAAGFVVGRLNDMLLIATTPRTLIEDGYTEVLFDPAGAGDNAFASKVWDDGMGLYCLLGVDLEDAPSYVELPPLAPMSAISQGETVYRVGMGANSSDELVWNLLPGEASLDESSSNGLYLVPCDSMSTTHVGGPVINENGTVVGITVLIPTDGGQVIEYVMALDTMLAVMERDNVTFQTGSAGGGSSSQGGSQGGGSQGGGGSGSGGSGSGGGGSQGGGGSGSDGGGSGSGGSGSGGGGLPEVLKDALSGGAIGIVAAVIAGLFLLSRRKKKNSGSSGGSTPPSNLSGGSTPPANFSGGAPSGFSGGATVGVNQFPGGATVGLASGGAAITGRGGLMNGKRFPLQGGGMGLGRDPARCAVVYPNGTPGVSAMHCQVVSQGGAWAVMDMGSTYGTFVNGRRLQPSVPCPLRPGDSFYLGQPDNTFVFEGV